MWHNKTCKLHWWLGCTVFCFITWLPRLRTRGSPIVRTRRLCWNRQTFHARESLSPQTRSPPACREDRKSDTYYAVFVYTRPTVDTWRVCYKEYREAWSCLKFDLLDTIISSLQKQRPSKKRQVNARIMYLDMPKKDLVNLRDGWPWVKARWHGWHHPCLQIF